MFHRPLSTFRARLAAGSAGLLAVAGLLVACVDPRPSEPLTYPPIAEAEEPELYGAPSDEPGQEYAEAEPAPEMEPAPGDAPPAEVYAEAQRPGWGTMAPVPNPPGSPAAERGRAYARVEPAAPATDGRPSERDRVGAYEVPPAPEAYAERAPAPQPYPAPEAPYAEGQPASSFPSTVITMPPIPNPVEARREPRVRDVIEPRGERRAADAPVRRSAERRARVTDERLMGGPARPAPQQRAAATSTQRQAAPAARPAERPRAAAAAPARQAQAQARPQRQARPAANTPAGRQAALDRVRAVLTTSVERDSTLAFDPPGAAREGVSQRVTLTLPNGLAESLRREAEANGLRALASRAELRTLLRGENWRIEPEEPLSGPLQPGQVSSFTWTATPGRDAGPLVADVSANLSGGNRFETLDLGEVRREVEGTSATRERTGGLGARAIGAAALLVLLLLGALWYARRDGNGVGDGNRRRFNRRRPDPVNLTPYSPAADTDAPRDTGPARDPNPA